jgi:tetratricopeptide (TPR) repeat protein
VVRWRNSMLALLVLLWPLAAELKPRTHKQPQIPAIRLDEGLIVSECGQKPQGPDVPVFRSEVPCVEMLLRLVNISGTHKVRFLYYDPEGQLYASTSPDWIVQPSSGSIYHRNGWVRHRLPIAAQEASTRVGDWKVAVWLDGLTVSEKLFRLEWKPALMSEDLELARQMYLELHYEEALVQVGQLAAANQEPELHAEALWWLALIQSALGRESEARESIQRLLQTRPSFAISGAEAREYGGEPLVAVLEELRSQSHPELYRQTIAPPELELSKPEAPPELQKPRRWYQKWWFYAGVAAVAIPATALLAGGDRVIEEGPPSLGLTAQGNIDLQSGLLFDITTRLQIDILGGKPPFEILITVANVGTGTHVQIDGSTPRLGTTPLVLYKGSASALGTSVITPPQIKVIQSGPCTIDRPCDCCHSALLRFGAIVKDAGSAASLSAATVGAPVPASILDLLSSNPRVIRQEISQGLVTCRRRC